MKTKLILTLLTAFAATSLFAADSPKNGSAAPAFSLKDAKGKTHALADYKGKYVVLEWFNPECPFVKKHYGSDNMQNLQKESAGKEVVWMTINSSAKGKEGHLTAETATKQSADWKMTNTTLLLDEDGKVGQAYGAKTTPHMFIINPEGKLIYQGANRQQGDSECRRHRRLDQLREGRTRRGARRQAGEQREHEAVWLLGEVRKPSRVSIKRSDSQSL